MSLYYGPKIVSNNLIAYWDASNPKSYNPSAPTFVYNILSNGMTFEGSNFNYNNSSFPFSWQFSDGNLITNPIFSSNENGCIILWMQTTQLDISNIIREEIIGAYCGYKQGVGIMNSSCGSPSVSVDLKTSFKEIDNMFDDKYHMWIFENLDFSGNSWEYLQLMFGVVGNLNCALYYNQTLSNEQKLQNYKMFLSRFKT
jgi:hypothetical protein